MLHFLKNIFKKKTDDVEKNTQMEAYFKLLEENYTVRQDECFDNKRECFIERYYEMMGMSCPALRDPRGARVALTEAGFDPQKYMLILFDDEPIDEDVRVKNGTEKIIDFYGKPSLTENDGIMEIIYEEGVLVTIDPQLKEYLRENWEGCFSEKANTYFSLKSVILNVPQKQDEWKKMLGKIKTKSKVKVASKAKVTSKPKVGKIAKQTIINPLTTKLLVTKIG